MNKKNFADDGFKPASKGQQPGTLSTGPHYQRICVTWM